MLPLKRDRITAIHINRVPLYEKAIQEYEKKHPDEVGRFIIVDVAYALGCGPRMDDHKTVFQVDPWCGRNCTELFKLVDSLSHEMEGVKV